jgi:paraquat-inducible protein B
VEHNTPNIKASHKFNFFTSIWIVPFIAFLIASWLAFEYFTQLGPKIEIVFKNNNGLKAGQSQIKYRDVVIGKIEKISLSGNGDGVKVTARMDREAIPYLNNSAEFWIVKPEVGVGGISGLDTIISGTYVNMSSQKSKMNQKEFIGLEKSLKVNKNGIHLHLNASEGYHVAKGTPIFFKNIRAGEVEDVHISSDGRSVDIYIFIKKDFIGYIHSDAKFWVQSALNINYLNGKLDFTLSPITNIVRGGIEFSSYGKNLNDVPNKDTVFRLYKNSSIAINKKIGKRGKDAVGDYLLSFTKSIANLSSDASVVYKGYDIGRVRDIKLLYSSKTHIISSDVIVSIDSSIFYDISMPKMTGEDNLKRAVKDGLRAYIRERDPLTRLQYIELAFSDTNTTREIISKVGYGIFPTVNNVEYGFMSELKDILNSIKELPLDKLANSLDVAINSFSDILIENKKSTANLLISVNKTLVSVNKLVSSKPFNKMPTEINQTLKALQKALTSLDYLIKGDSSKSLLSSQMTETLKEVSKTSIATQKLMRQLDRKPNSLIFGD